MADTEEQVQLPVTPLQERSFRRGRDKTVALQLPCRDCSPLLRGRVEQPARCARALGLQLRVRSGGRDYEGLSYVAYGRAFVVLDLQKLNAVDVDGRHGIAWVQAGATVGELYYSIGKKNLTAGFPAGLCPAVGVGGHLSGGGIGTMMRKHGLASDNIVDARVVDVHGEVLDKESMGEDLFWAIRGGGGASFGVVLAYKVRLVHVPPTVKVFAKPANSGNVAPLQLVLKWQEVAFKMEERLFIRQFSQVSNRTLQVSFQSLFLGPKGELLPVMAQSFPELRSQEDDCKEMSWVESVKYFAGYANGAPLDVLLSRQLQVPPYSFKAKSDFLTEPILESGWREIWDRLVENGETMFTIVDPLGRKMDRIAKSEMPFPHRKGSLYNIQYLVAWLEEGGKGDETHIDWMRRFYEFMTPYVSKNPRATYVNYRDLDFGSSHGGIASYTEASVWGRKYFKSNFRRLAIVKSKFDPENFFRNEQSIPPISS